MTKTRFLGSILMVAACSSDVDLSLETGEKGGQVPPFGEDPGDPPDPGSDPKGFPITDLPDTDMHRVEWTAEGHLLASGHILDDRLTFLRRYDADGIELWSSELDTTERPAPVFSAFASTAGGGTLAAVTRFDTRNGAVPVSLRTYDASGALVATRELTATDTSDAVIAAHDIAVLADGGFLLAGVEDDADNTAFVARFDASGERQWTLPITWVGDDLAPDEYNVPSVAKAISDLTLTADQGIVFHGRYHGDVTVGDCAASNSEIRDASSAYVARVELDGTCSWLQTILDLDLPATVANAGIGVISDGHILFVGASWAGLVTAEGFRLEEEVSFANDYYVAELDASGSVVGLNALQHSQALDDGDYILFGQSAAVRGDHLLFAAGIEKYTLWASQALPVGENYVGVYDRQGNVVDEIRTSTAAVPDTSSGWALTIAVSSAGRIALAGFFAGEADFGAGPVRTEANADDEYQPFQASGYIAVFDTVDVD